MTKLNQFISGFFEQIAKTTDNVWALLISEKGYASLFKAGVVLVSASMIAISQAGSIVYDSDIAAHKEKFQVEAMLGSDLQQSSQCFSLPPEQVARCRGVLYELAQVQSAWSLSLKIFEYLFRLGLALLALSAVAFVLNASKQSSR